MKYKVFLTTLFLIWYSGCTGTTDPLITQDKLTKIDSLLTSLYNSGQFNGTFLIGNQDEVLFQGHYGYQNLSAKAKITDESIFELASVSKTITATIVMKLIEEGIINRESRLTDFFPELPYADVTVDHLLTHTSGVPDYYQSIVDPHWDKSESLTIDELFELYTTHKPKASFQAGEKFQYSNTGYLFLAGIIEKATKRTYDEALEKYVSKPAGIDNLARKVYLNKSPAYAMGHVLSEKQGKFVTLKAHENYQDMIHAYFSESKGPGSISTTALGLWKFSNALTNGKIINEQTLDDMWEPGKLNDGKRNSYARGWQVTKIRRDELRHHRGGTEGYNTFFVKSLKNNYSYVLLTNVQQPYLSQINVAIGNIINGRSIQPILKSGAEHTRLLVSKLSFDELEEELRRVRTKTDKYYFTLTEFNSAAWTYWLKEQYDEAFVYLKLATVAMPKNAGVVEVLAEAYMETNNYPEAIRLYKKTIEMLNNDDSKKGKKWVKEWIVEMKEKIEMMSKS